MLLLLSVLMSVWMVSSLVLFYNPVIAPYLSVVCSMSNVYNLTFTGKRPRDLLNPKAVNHMQSIFSIKDAISKKESRELSASFGITVTQV